MPRRGRDGVGDPFDHCLRVPGKGADGCRLPDEDGDGFASTSTDKRTRDCNDDVREINPNAREVLGNDVDENCDGLAAFDRDGDHSEDKPGPDCDPTNRKIHPGAREIRGNKIDEDCDKSDAPFLRVTSQVAPTYLLDSRERVRGFAGFKVLPVVKGMRIRVECRGRGCPYSARVYRAKRTRSGQTVGREFNGRALPVGARVTVKVLRKGYVGRAIRFTIKRGAGDPRIIKRCMLPGRTALRKKC